MRAPGGAGRARSGGPPVAEWTTAALTPPFAKSFRIEFDASVNYLQTFYGVVHIVRCMRE
ncbi:protein of unknown function [Burkholderia multivorans]